MMKYRSNKDSRSVRCHHVYSWICNLGIRWIVAVSAILWSSSASLANDGSSPSAEARITALVDLVDNYEHGLTAGANAGDHFGFGLDLLDPGGFELVSGQGLFNSTAARLSTDDNGFGGSSTVIGYLKRFALSIDASGCPTIRYWVKNDTENCNSNVSVLLELVVGDGGDMNRSDENNSFTGSTWTQFTPQRLSDLEQCDTGGVDGFTKVDVNLEGSFVGVVGGFSRTVAPSNFGDQFDLTDELLRDITAVNIIMSRNGDTGVQRAILVDNILFVRSSFSLTIESLPIREDIPITGSFSNDTPFVESGLADGSDVTLTAPLTHSTEDGTDLAFLHWILDAIQISDDQSITFELSQNSKATAIYERENQTLNIASSGVSEVLITGEAEADQIITNISGNTNFDMEIGDNSTVTLQAPEIHIDTNGNQFKFVEWQRGQEQTVDNIITFDINEETFAIAVYELNQRTLTVESTVDSVSFGGLSIEGDPSEATGTTPYNLSIITGTQITLTAPLTQSMGIEQYKFIRWKIGNEEQDLGKNIINFNLDTNITVTADYVLAATLLTVRSLPVDGVMVTGPNGMITNYTQAISGNTEVTLEAPSPHDPDGLNLIFKHWIRMTDTSIEQPILDNPITRIITEDTNFIAVYNPIWQLRPGWNLVSTPLVLDAATVATILSSLEPVWFWDGVRFRVATDIVPGLGYWVFVIEETTIKLVGTEPASGSMIALHPDWNLIGTMGCELISDPFVSSRFSIPANFEVADNFWGWKDNQQSFFTIRNTLLPIFEQNVLFPGIGYWVFLKAVNSP